MSDKSEGLKAKYYVDRVDGKPMKGGCIVLEFGDKNARPALKVWADTVRACGYVQLADDVELKLEATADL